MEDDSDDAATTADGVSLEVSWNLPPERGSPTAVVVLTHPHPQMGGDMHNPVPAGIAQRCARGGLACLRGNFRGVGRSGGRHDGGNAERLDVVALVEAATERFPGLPLYLVGYSFGADVVLSISDDRVDGVVAVAAPLAVIDTETLAAARGAAPTLLLVPEHDRFRPPDDARQVAGDWPSTAVEVIAGCDHFMGGGVGWAADRTMAFVADAG